jgi:hypothetical protein
MIAMIEAQPGFVKAHPGVRVNQEHESSCWNGGGSHLRIAEVIHAVVVIHAVMEALNMESRRLILES